MDVHWLLLIAWITTEVVLLVRRRSKSGGARDQGSMRVLWVAMVVAINVAIFASFVPGYQLPGAGPILYRVGVIAMSAGLALRWWSVAVLGRFFTVDVAIHGDHELVQRGPYRFVRHPSYSALFLILAGFACVLGSTLSALTFLVLVVPAFAWRIGIEERALREAFGERYVAYSRRTKRLIPGVY